MSVSISRKPNIWKRNKQATVSFIAEALSLAVTFNHNIPKGSSLPPETVQNSSFSFASSLHMIHQCQELIKKFTIILFVQRI